MKRVLCSLLMLVSFAVGLTAQDKTVQDKTVQDKAAQDKAVQDKKEEKLAFGVSFAGFIKTDIFYDSRQTLNIREGHFLLYPKPPQLDPNGADINDVSNINMLSLQSRLQAKVTAPNTFGAATGGLIEGEFFGHSDPDINGFRLRHAYLSLNWTRTELLVGQYWHPMFVTESFPDVVSFNTGAPFQPFNRSPQVRVTRKLGRASVAFTALTQRDFASTGPDGVNTGYLRNAASPELNVRAQYGIANAALSTETLVGASVNYLRVRPRLATPAGFRTDATVGGMAGMVFFKQRLPALTFKAEAFYGQNSHHLTMVGGYACRGVEPETLASEYTTLNTFSAWSDVHTNGRRWQGGLFAGYSKNLGATDDIFGACYARGTDIDSLYRVSPRLVLNVSRFRFATETEWTAAAYGTPDVGGNVRNAKSTGNLRVLFATYLFF